MKSEFEKAFKKEYPHADYLACLKFDEVENQYKPINEEVEPPDVNFWVCVGVNTGWWAWQHRQTEVDELKLQVAEMKSRLNDAYTDGQSAMYAARQSKVDELQKRVDQQGLIIAKVMSIASDLQKSWEMFEIGKKLEQALKGGSDE